MTLTRPPEGLESPDVRRVPVEDLHLAARNPRVQDRGRELGQDEILEILWREFAVNEIALSIAANGYLTYEPLIGVAEGGDLVVVEGNRRLAAVRLLREPDLRRALKATDLPRISTGAHRNLDTLPFMQTTREAVWEYVGFKHVNGAQPWQSYSKAQYIAWVHNHLEVPLEEIGRRIGDYHSTVVRLYRALMVLEQAERADVFHREDRAKPHFAFSHLMTGLGYRGIQQFIGLSTEEGDREPARDVRRLGRLCEWMYGSVSKGKDPVIRSQNPDLRVLDEVIQDDNGVAALGRGLPLSAALDISKGDEQLLREALVATKQALQEAKGTVRTGYHGDSGLLRDAEDIRDLADSLYDEMLEIRDDRRRRSRGRPRSTNRE